MPADPDNPTMVDRACRRCGTTDQILEDRGQGLECQWEAACLLRPRQNSAITAWAAPQNLGPLLVTEDLAAAMDLPWTGVSSRGIEWPTYTYRLVWERPGARWWRRWRVAVHEVATYSDGRTSSDVHNVLGRFWTQRAAYLRVVDLRFVIRLMGGTCES